MEPREKYVNVFFTREELTSNEDGKKFCNKLILSKKC
jgi:hypothetical protein